MPALPTVPVALFAYARPDHLRRTLACLRENHVPLLYAFVDGPAKPETAPKVAAVREVLRAVDWTEVVLCERQENLGLGRSILTGVTEVLTRHPAAIVFEDDLLCVPGTYAWFCAALEQYRTDFTVMSITGWTHPRAIPPGIGVMPYFDGRAECWTWATWARSWGGMQQPAATLAHRCEQLGLDSYRYGADLPYYAAHELERNIWAVRWLYWHMLNGGLCLRPPHTLVEHIGHDAGATNVTGDEWSQPLPASAPPLPATWPAAMEHPACATLWQAAYGGRPSALRLAYRAWRQAVRDILRRARQ